MSLTDRLAAFFRQRPNVWVDGRELGTIAGAYAWRSRCADLRRRGMVIENRQRRVEHYRISEYRWVPVEPQQADLLAEAGQVAACGSEAA